MDAGLVVLGEESGFFFLDVTVVVLLGVFFAGEDFLFDLGGVCVLRAIEIAATTEKRRQFYWRLLPRGNRPLP